MNNIVGYIIAEFQNAPIATVAALIAILGGFFVVLKFVLVPFRRYLISIYTVFKAIKSDYKTDIKDVTFLYIKTKGQHYDPCDSNEESPIGCEKFDLVPFFLEEFFEDKVENRYGMVCGDSGMGKTTFMQQLYIKQSIKFGLRKKKIVLLSLGKSDVLEKISEIKDQADTILLLDALDENINAIRDLRTFFETLCQKTEDFYKVVISCRTQFFTSVYDEPRVAPVLSMSLKNKNSYIYKIYLSLLTDKDIERYLYRKFLFNKKLRKKAFELVDKIPTLSLRPIVLYWIKELITKPDEIYAYKYQIYENVINNWINREPEKYTKGKLFSFSLKVARQMMKKGELFLDSETVATIAKGDDIDLEPIIANSRSLLNRNGDGLYKFAHRAFYEYFVSVLELNYYEQWMDEYNKNDISRETVELIVEQLKSKKSFKIHLSNINFSEFNIDGCNFDNAILNHVKFDYCTAENTSFRNSNLSDVSFFGTNFKMSQDSDIFDGAMAKDCDFREYQNLWSLLGIKVTNSHFYKYDLRATKLDVDFDLTVNIIHDEEERISKQPIRSTIS